MDLYFKIKTITEFFIPVLIVLAIIVIWLAIGIYKTIKNKLKRNLLEREGYVFKVGLGRTAEYQYQSHWVKDKHKIHHRKAELMKMKNLKEEITKNKL